VATLSTGPVGFSDALGHTNASLVLSTCRSDGLLLKPSLPLRAIDRTFSRVEQRAPVPPGAQNRAPPQFLGLDSLGLEESIYV
jgi:hypothetical protein